MDLSFQVIVQTSPWPNTIMSKLLDSFQRDTGARTSLCKLVTLCPQKYMVGYHFVEDSNFLRAEPTFEQFQKKHLVDREHGHTVLY